MKALNKILICNVTFIPKDAPKKGEILTVKKEIKDCVYFEGYPQFAFLKEHFRQPDYKFTYNLINWLMIAKDIPYEG